MRNQQEHIRFNVATGFEVKSVNLIVIDRSSSMSENGKWQGVLSGVESIKHKNRGNGSVFKMVVFNDKYKVTDAFVPAELMQPIMSQPDGGTAMYDGLKRSLEWGYMGTNKFAEHVRPSLSVHLLTDGYDNESDDGSALVCRLLIKGLIEEMCPDRKYDQSKFVMTHWAFGASFTDQRHQENVYDSLGLPKIQVSNERTERIWFRYMNGERRNIERATSSIGDMISEMSMTGRTVIGDV